MKNLFLSLALTLASTWAFSQEITGQWLTDDGEAVVEIFKSGEKLDGKIVWLRNPNDKNGKPLKDTENPDIGKRSRPLIGLLMLTDFMKNKDKWEGGRIYDPSEGKTYKSSMWIEKGKLKVRGYVGIFYETQTWSRK